MDKEGIAIDPVIQAKGLVKTYGRVVALDQADFELYPDEVLAVIGDNGAGKSTLIKAISGAIGVDSGKMFLEGREVRFSNPLEARRAGIETVYQNLSLSPALSITDNMFMGRQLRKKDFIRGRVLRLLDYRAMEKFARERLEELEVTTVQNIRQSVETLSGGQRQAIAVIRAAAFAKRFIIMDEPTAALGVKEGKQVLKLILDIKSRGIPVILISHNMPHVFEVADRIHIHRLGKRLCVVNPKECSMSDAVAMMTGAMEPPKGAVAGVAAAKKGPAEKAAVKKGPAESSE